jgi:choline kinase
MYNRNTSPVLGSKEPIDIIIPAAGSGRRIKVYGCKSLLKITTEETIISRQIKKIRKFFENSTIILVCGFESTLLMNNTPKDIVKIENEKFEENNVARSIGMGLRASTANSVLLIYGDLVFNDEAMKVLNPHSSCLLTEQNGTMGDDEIGCTVDKESEVVNMLPDLPTKWCQIGVFCGKELDKLKKYCWSDNRKKYFGFEIINEIIEDGGRFESVTSKSLKITDVDCPKDLNIAREMIK